LVLVLGLIVMLVTTAGILALNVTEHDPLVQADVVQHFAYRALEAGINTYLSDVNADSNLINCTSASGNGGQCTPSDYNTWQQVLGTQGSGQVPEWYAWGNPTPCFNPLCTTPSNPNTLPLQYVKVNIWGAAGYANHIVYQTSSANFGPENGFLSRVWWSNYEATDPYLTGNPNSDCTWNYANGYNGPVVSGNNPCAAVYFGPNDKVFGPIFSNDSIYVTGGPTLGPVTTADPKYLFCTDTNGTCSTTAAGSGVTQTAADAANSSFGAAQQALPQYDSSLEAWAKLGGCVYTGPTTITFDANDMMTVWSPDSVGAPTTTSTCLPTSPATVNVPNGTNGNGVIYVQSANSGCTSPITGSPNAGANPYDNLTSGNYGPNAQLNYLGTYTNYYGATAQPDCEGDAFVSDNPGSGSSPLPSAAGGVSGQLTIATDNNIVITGNIEYTDCGGSFNLTQPQNGPCPYNVAPGNNDALGLIANNYVEVNHPVLNDNQDCTTSGGRNPVTTCQGANANSNEEPNCKTAQLGLPAAALCTPGGTLGGTPGSNNNLIIDAAILALNHSFTVNNEGGINSGGGDWGAGPLLGTLTIYGSLDQDWRGAVGIIGNSGYGKDYDWDSRLQLVTPPHYLNPDTPSWALNSSSTNLSPPPPTPASNPPGPGPCVLSCT